MRIYSSARIAVIVGLLMVLSAASFAQIGVGISVNFGPPAIPVYVQPPCPQEGYIWTPGYWAWDPSYSDYYWVPGTWVLAPQPGFLWTPGWWGWGGSAFLWHAGYWGPHVGFYGGINYGFGYFGNGFEGGRWQGDHFFYNRSVTNINETHITNVYNTTVINNNNSRVAYNGGNGGLTARPAAEEQRYDGERHVGPVAAQTQHVDAARGNPELRASANHGKPPIAATQRPNEFRGEGAVPAKEAGGEYTPHNEGGNREANVPKPPAHASDVQPHEKMPAPNTGNAKLDQKYQKQQDKMYAKQQQDHQKLAQQQEKEHQQMAKQQANQQKQQQMEQRHAQQTQQMEQRHTQQQQQMQARQAPHEQGGGGHPR